MTTPNENRETTIESRMAYEGKIVNVRVDTVRMANGRIATREVVEHASVVCIAPVDEDGNVLMVRQYRKPAEATLMEVPAGGMEPGETPEEAALRELQEETGLTAGKLERLMTFWATPGFCDEKMYAFLAADLAPGDPAHRPDHDEEIESLSWVPLSQVPKLIRDGQICDAKSIALLMLAHHMLRGGG